MKAILEKLARREALTREQASSAMREMIEGRASDEQTKELLLALREKGPTPDEIAGFARVMREHAVPFPLKREGFIDVCGTGGDSAGTFNISTTVALVVASGGVGVAKHGNRAVSSRSGSGDVLEALGLKADQSPDEVALSVERHGIGFFFAPTFHPALKRFAEVRRSLKVRTIFNILGPLANPAGVKRQLVGVFDTRLTETMAHTLRELGSVEAMVVSGEDGLDELSLAGRTRVAHLKNGHVTNYTVTPSDAGLASAPISALAGGDPRENAAILVAILSGNEKGARRDAVLYNAAAAFMIAGKARDLIDGVRQASAAIDSGAALKLLEALQGARS